MNIQEIMRILPHRYPFLLLDRIVELRPGKMAVGIKNISINEPYFAGHFPGQPIMPGVMMIEAMAQVGACALLADELFQGQLAYLAGVDRIRFKRLIPSNNPSLAIDNQGGIRQKIQNIGHYPLFNFLIAIQYPVLPVIYYYHS